MTRVLSIGGATQDIFLLYEGADTMHLHLQTRERSYMLFEQGTKVDIPSLHYATGGGATNAGVSFKRLGLDVELFLRSAQMSLANLLRMRCSKKVWV